MAILCFDSPIVDSAGFANRQTAPTSILPIISFFRFFGFFLFPLLTMACLEASVLGKLLLSNVTSVALNADHVTFGLFMT